MNDKNDTMQRSRPQNKGKASFTVFIELRAAMDYMTTLRGITTEGKYYPDRTSLELTRFPSFDGTDWELPEPFPDFFENAVHKRDLFRSAKPYDFAVREIEYVVRQGADAVFYIPLDMASHYIRIRDWTQRYFPGSRVVVGDIKDINQQPDLWIARSPAVVKHLQSTNQPFVLVDGKENAHINDAVRAIRWDQAGFILRHSQRLQELSRTTPNLLASFSPPRANRIKPYMDVYHGISFFPPNVSEAALWIGRERAITETFLSSDFDFRFKSGKKMSVDGTRRAVKAARGDYRDLEHKQEVLHRYMEEGFSLRLAYPRFAHWLELQEVEAQSQLRIIEKIFGVDPVSGATRRRARQPNIPSAEAPGASHTKKRQSRGFGPVNRDTQKIKITREDLGIPANAEARDLLTFFSTTALESGPTSMHFSQVVGTMAERLALHVIAKNGWKVFQPRENAQEPRTNIPGQIVINWIDADDVLQYADVDGFARDPKGNFHIIEAKASSGATTSNRQKRLKNHLDSGGKILNPNCVGVRKDTPEFSATYTIVTFADQVVQQTPATTSRSRSR